MSMTTVRTPVRPLVVDCEIWKGESELYLIFGGEVYRAEIDHQLHRRGIHGDMIVFGSYVCPLDSFVGEFCGRARAAIRCRPN
jgi:hypothetical protein